MGIREKPIGELIRYTMCTYRAMCRNYIFTSDKEAEESNGSVSVGRESGRCLFGQELDMGSPWCNSMFESSRGGMAAEGRADRESIRT